jgi:hypothetical protein
MDDEKKRRITLLEAEKGELVPVLTQRPIDGAKLRRLFAVTRELGDLRLEGEYTFRRGTR